jgi:hypothetical protein
MKQLPYTMVQLSAFTYFVDHVYATTPQNVDSMELAWSLTPCHSYGFLDSRYGIQKSNMSKHSQISVSVGCGVGAGVLSAIASHPADTILSRINMAAKTGKEVQSVRTIAKELGFKGLWLGVGPRCLFTGLLSATIFLVYDSVKLMFGLATTSGLNAKKGS